METQPRIKMKNVHVYRAVRMHIVERDFHPTPSVVLMNAEKA